MSQLKELLDREASRIDADPGALESVLQRRNRRSRNQRMTAGVVGIAVFVAVVWIGTSLRFWDRTDPVVPVGTGTTGPANTGSTGPPDAAWDGNGIPPEGTLLSSPVEGELVKAYPGFHTPTFVYADGRVIWYVQGANPILGGGQTLERRLTLEGVDLVRSGAELDGIPDSAWADAEGRVYAPPTYEVCLSRAQGDLDPSAAMDRLPPPAQALLRGLGADPRGGWQENEYCLVVATADARALDQMLSEAGLVPAEAHRVHSATSWYVDDDRALRVNIRGLLPHGVWFGLKG